MSNADFLVIGSALDYALIILTAFVVSGLALFSGFGLGTVLMPAFAVFFPVPTAIAATAVVHLAKNFFKVGLIGKRPDWCVVLRFGVPAAIAAALEAGTLILFAGLPMLGVYEFLGQQHEVTPVKLVIGIVVPSTRRDRLNRAL